MEETLEAGLTRLFGGGAARPADVQLTRGPAAADAPDAAPAVAQPQAPAGNDQLSGLAVQARGHYDRATGLRRGLVPRLAEGARMSAMGRSRARIAPKREARRTIT